MGLAPSSRNRQISMERYALSRDIHNQPSDAWTAFVTDEWVSWRRATANERLSAGQTGAQVTDIFEADWTPAAAGATPKDRLIYEGLVYDIIEVTEIGYHEGLLIRAAANADGKP